MEINEQIIPIVYEAIKWIKEKMKPTKKELQIQVSELEEQVKTLSYGNQNLMENMGQIMCIILSKLQSDGNYIINADNIIQIKDNNAPVCVMGQGVINIAQVENERKKLINSIFDNMDDEIIESRLSRPSDEEK